MAAKKEGTERDKNGRREPVHEEQRRTLHPAWLFRDSQFTLRNSLLNELGTFLFPYPALLQNPLALHEKVPVLTLLHVSSLNQH